MMAAAVLATLVLLASCGLPDAAKVPARKSHLAYRLLKGETCKDGRRHYAKLYDNYTGLIDKRGNLLMNGIFELFKRARIKKMEVKIHRCKDAVSFNTCEYYATWPFSVGLCPLMMSPGMLWTNAVKSISPPIGCDPVEAGVYTVTNGSLDMSLVERVAPIDPAGSVWVVDITFYDISKDLYACMTGSLHVYRVSTHH